MDDPVTSEHCCLEGQTLIHESLRDTIVPCHRAIHGNMKHCARHVVNAWQGHVPGVTSLLSHLAQPCAAGLAPAFVTASSRCPLVSWRRLPPGNAVDDRISPAGPEAPGHRPKRGKEVTLTICSAEVARNLAV